MTKVTNKLPTLVKGDKLNTEIDKFAKSAANIQKRAHVLALSVLDHLQRTSDVRVTLKFINAMPAMVRTNGLREWFSAYGNIAFDEKGAGTFVKKDKVKGDLLMAHLDPFWNFKANEGGEYRPLEARYFEQVMAKLTKDAEKTGKDYSAAISALAAIAKPQPTSADPLVN